MTATTLTSFAGLVSDLLGAVRRLLDTLTNPDELSEAAERLSAVERDVTAVVVGVRRDLERLLEQGVPSRQFAVQMSPFAESIKRELLNREGHRAQLLALPAQVAALVLPDFDGLLRETRTLDALLTEALAVATAPLPAGLWERAEDGAKGPFYSEETVKAELRAHGKL